MPDSEEHVQDPKSSEEWTAYVSAPTMATLNALLRVAPPLALVRALEEQFFSTNVWRIAQHAALIHSGRLDPNNDEARDLVRASYFALRARDISSGHPAARLLLARVLWERRVPLAVLHEASLAEGAIADERTLTSEQKDVMQRELSMLTALAAAYIGDVERAHAVLAAQPFVSLEALAQLLVAAWPEQREIGSWAAARLAVLPLNPKSRTAALVLNVFRWHFVETLRSREARAR